MSIDNVRTEAITVGKGSGCCGPECCSPSEKQDSRTSEDMVSSERASIPDEPEQVVAAVRERYGRIAAGKESGCCGSLPCGTTETDVAVQIGYAPGEIEALPDGANLGLGCGAPIASLGLAPGETVLDLGSGAGVDAVLAARIVGAEGKVIGVDMTPEMLERARANCAAAGLAQVEFREGRLESLPVEDASVDAVTSNCVINLVPDKAVVFREIARVLRPGGRLVISDIVLDGPLPDVLAHDLLAYVGCVAGAEERGRYFSRLEAAGLSNLHVLRDIDYLTSAGYELPETVREKMKRAGIATGDLGGKIRSLTYRAEKPA
jgi:SAM-dependent methyltransferase